MWLQYIGPKSVKNKNWRCFAFGIGKWNRNFFKAAELNLKVNYFTRTPSPSELCSRDLPHGSVFSLLFIPFMRDMLGQMISPF